MDIMKTPACFLCMCVFVCTHTVCPPSNDCAKADDGTISKIKKKKEKHKTETEGHSSLC